MAKPTKLDAAKAKAALKLKSTPKTDGVKDMYSNQASNTGWLTTSQVNAGRHIPFRISLDYQKLVFMYRGSWIIRAIVDKKPHLQHKEFPKLLCQVTPEDITEFNRVIAETATLQKYIEGRRWGRLYGGALGIIIIEGDNDLMKPLVLEDVPLGSYKGMIIVDRWSGMSPSSELISDLNNPAEYGNPESYTVYTEASQNLQVHHSRCLRFVGRDLPLFEKQIETYWGMSEIECVLDELQRYDFGMAGVADLISRANVLCMKEPMLAQMLSGVNMTAQQYTDYVGRMAAVSENITTNGLMVVGEEGEIFQHSYSFGGLSDVMKMQMTAMCGAAGYPFSVLFGDTQTGLGQSNEGDLQNFYDECDQERKQKDRPLFDKLIPIICMSTWGEVPEDLDYTFAPMRTLNAKEKAELAKTYGETITGYANAGIFSPQTAMREVQSTSAETGIGTNVTDEEVEAASPDAIVGEVPSEPNEKLEAEPEKGAKDAAPEFLSWLGDKFDAWRTMQ